MRVFAVRDEEDTIQKDYAYLIYYEAQKRFYIELPDDADPWETPLLLSSLLKKGCKTIGSYWSKLWVQQRIVPENRQNIGQILRDNGLDEYDEFGLLILADGRCAQDSFYLVETDMKSVEERFKDRYEIKVEDVIPLSNNHLIVFFRNGECRRCNISDIVGDIRYFSQILRKPEIFERVSVQPGGYGVRWGDFTEIEDRILYHAGESLSLSIADLECFLKHSVVNTAETAEILGCSRQNINDLVLRGKLHPLRSDSKSRYFLKSEVSKRLWM